MMLAWSLASIIGLGWAFGPALDRIDHRNPEREDVARFMAILIGFVGAFFNLIYWMIRYT